MPQQGGSLSHRQRPPITLRIGTVRDGVVSEETRICDPVPWRAIVAHWRWLPRSAGGDRRQERSLQLSSPTRRGLSHQRIGRVDMYRRAAAGRSTLCRRRHADWNTPQHAPADTLSWCVLRAQVTLWRVA